MNREFRGQNVCADGCQMRELLDMKQQQAGIIEAKAAIRRADEAVLQGRSIVVFTVFTIFFVSHPPFPFPNLPILYYTK